MKKEDHTAYRLFWDTGPISSVSHVSLTVIHRIITTQHTTWACVRFVDRKRRGRVRRRRKGDDFVYNSFLSYSVDRKMRIGNGSISSASERGEVVQSGALT